MSSLIWLYPEIRMNSQHCHFVKVTKDYCSPLKYRQVRHKDQSVNFVGIQTHGQWILYCIIFFVCSLLDLKAYWKNATSSHRVDLTQSVSKLCSQVRELISQSNRHVMSSLWGRQSTLTVIIVPPERNDRLPENPREGRSGVRNAVRNRLAKKPACSK